MKIARWARVFFAGTAITSITLAGCAGGDEQPAGEHGQDADRTLRFAASTDEGCVDPQQQDLVASLAISRQVVDSLTYQNVDGDIVPWLAESWEINADSTSYTFTLREGVTFSDGAPFDAEVVRANFDGIIELGLKAPDGASYLHGYVGSEVIDSYTVRIDFDQPSAQFLQASSTPALGMLSPKTLARRAGERCSGAVAGTGPFVVEEYEPDSGVVLARRDGYGWAPEGFANSGDALLAGIEVSYVPDPSVRVGQLLSGQIDGMADVASQDFERLNESPDVQLFARANPGLTTNLFLTMDSGPLADEAVRKALLIGIDREELISTTMTAVDEASTSVLSPTTPGYTALPDFLKYAPDDASTLLDEAGWAMGANGIREKNGEPLSVSVIYGTPFQDPRVPLLELTKQQLAGIGVNLEIDAKTPAAWREAQNTGTFDLLLSAATRADPNILTQWYLGLDDELDSLLQAQGAEPDVTERKQLVAEASQHILEHAYSIPLYDLNTPFAYSHSVSDTEYDAGNLPYFSTTSITE